LSWHECLLGEAIREDGGVLQTGPFGSQLHQSDYTSQGIPVIMPKDIHNGEVLAETVARVSEATADRLSRHRIATNGIVLPRRGEVTKRAFIHEDQTGWLCGTGCLKIESTGKHVWPKFLYYYLGTPSSVEWLKRNAVGSTMLNLSTEIVSRFPIRLPPINVQKQITDILINYDALIENNRRCMTLLKDAARMLYREWFVRFRFPSHEHFKIIDGIPDGWQRRSFGQIAGLNYGKALKEENRVEGTFPVYGSSGVVGTHHTALAEGPGIIVGRKGNVGSIYWSPGNFWPIDTVYFVPKEQADFWLYLALPSAGFQNTDAGVPGLNREFAYSRKLICPTPSLRRLFNETVEPMFAQRTTLEHYNQKLAQARDLLLPRLMNGELAV
jgi:type I restriction enzyme, S subunit